MSAVATIPVVMLRSPRREARLRPSLIVNAQGFFTHLRDEYVLQDLVPVRINNLQGFFPQAVSDAPYLVITSFDNDGGMGDRREYILVTTDAAHTGVPANLVDGDVSSNNTVHSMLVNSGQTGREIRFEFQAPHVIDVLRWYASGDQSDNEGWWRFEGSPDGLLWTPLSSHFMLSSLNFTAQDYPFLLQTQGYKYYRIKQGHGFTQGTGWLREAQFSIGLGAGLPPMFQWDGALSSGPRSDLIAVTTTMTGASGSIQSLVNGDFNPGVGNSYQRGGSVTGETITFDFGSPIRLGALSWLQDTSGSSGEWRLRYSDDGDIWGYYIDSEATFVLGNKPTTVIHLQAEEEYRYWRLEGVSGTMGGSTWILQTEFAIGTTPVVSLSPARVDNAQDFFAQTVDEVLLDDLVPQPIVNTQSFFEQEVEDIPPIDLTVGSPVVNAQGFFEQSVEEPMVAALVPQSILNTQDFFEQEVETVVPAFFAATLVASASGSDTSSTSLQLATQLDTLAVNHGDWSIVSSGGGLIVPAGVSRVSLLAAMALSSTQVNSSMRIELQLNGTPIANMPFRMSGDGFTNNTIYLVVPFLKVSPGDELTMHWQKSTPTSMGLQDGMQTFLSVMGVE